MDCLLGLARATPNPEAVTINDMNIIDSVIGSLSSCLSTDKIRAITFTFPDAVASYNRHRENLLVVDGVPMLGRRVIIPASCRKRVMESLHSAYQGTAKMLDRAKHSVYWPGIVDDLEQTRKRCTICNRNAPSQAQMPPLPLESPEFPFQMIALDYFEIKGKSWLAVADRFSGWLSKKILLLEFGMDPYPSIWSSQYLG